VTLDLSASLLSAYRSPITVGDYVVNIEMSSFSADPTFISRTSDPVLSFNQSPVVSMDRDLFRFDLSGEGNDARVELNGQLLRATRSPLMSPYDEIINMDINACCGATASFIANSSDLSTT